MNITFPQSCTSLTLSGSLLTPSQSPTHQTVSLCVNLHYRKENGKRGYENSRKRESDAKHEAVGQQKTITHLVAVSVLGRARVGNDPLSLTSRTLMTREGGSNTKNSSAEVK
jgi:hypothetical protein